MPTPSPSEAAANLNYQLIKDDVNAMRQFFERFLRCADALASVGPLEGLLDGRGREILAAEAELKERREELEALRETREQEGRAHDAKIVAAREEAARIV